MFDASELETIISEYKAGASLAQLGKSMDMMVALFVKN